MTHLRDPKTRKVPVIPSEGEGTMGEILRCYHTDCRGTFDLLFDKLQQLR